MAQIATMLDSPRRARLATSSPRSGVGLSLARDVERLAVAAASATRPVLRSCPSPTTPEETLLRLEGEYWTVAYGGVVVRLRDAVGIRHLAQLLWHPQREFHVLDLMRSLALAGRSREGDLRGRNASAVDARAATAYRDRLRELQEEMADAESRNDLGRSGALQEECDALLLELRHGARGRRMQLEAERARTAVTKSIKTALARIRQAHAALSDHLDASVRRGYVCVYRPDPRYPISWHW